MYSWYRLLTSVFLLLLISSLFAGPGNSAPNAKVSASSRFNDESSEHHVTDGVLRIDGRGEWVCAGSASWWGTVSYPWILTSRQLAVGGFSISQAVGLSVWFRPLPTRETRTRATAIMGFS